MTLRARVLAPIRIAGLMLVLGATLTACSPRHDWRQVSLADGQVRAIFPDKPLTSDRDFDFEGHSITFSLSSVNVDKVLYTVGYAALPEAIQTDGSLRDRLVARTQASLYQNLGLSPPDPAPVAGSRFGIDGMSQGQHLRLQAMVWATPHALIEGVVIGAADEFPQSHADEFFRELAPDLRPQ